MKNNLDQDTFAADYCSEIKVEPETYYPTKVWDKYKLNRKVIKVQPMDLRTPIFKDRIRFVCLSDTHSKMENMLETVPDGDILIHAGDFSNIGIPNEVKRFNELLGRLPHKYKVVIAGNHDQTFAEDFDDLNFRESNKIKQEIEQQGISTTKDLLTNCIYLQDSMVELYGIKIYGSPWQPEFCSWAFNVERGEELLEIWNQIPEETNILITHGPALGYGDKSYEGSRTGCVELLNTIQKRVRPKYHVFGHIHEGYGITNDGYTTYINASICTLRYKPTNPPIIFDISLPTGHSKEETLHSSLNEKSTSPQCQGAAAVTDCTVLPPLTFITWAGSLVSNLPRFSVSVFTNLTLACTEGRTDRRQNNKTNMQSLQEKVAGPVAGAAYKLHRR